MAMKGFFSGDSEIVCNREVVLQIRVILAYVS